MTTMIEQGCAQLVQTCADLKSGETVLIVSDSTTNDIAQSLEKFALTITSAVKHMSIEPFTMHGQEPPLDVAEAMANSNVIFGLTHMSMAHTQARLQATNNGARYLSLPDYSEAVLNDASLSANFRNFTQESKDIANILTKGKVARLTSDLGTDLTIPIHGREANAAPGWCEAPGTIASPPDAETNIAIVEQGAEGKLIVNGSIPYDGLGRLTAPIELQIADGKVSEILGDTDEVKLLKDLFWGGETNDKKRILAELGIGLNDKAKLCGIMLIDEGTRGTVHIGVGSNCTIGGANDVNFHLDLVINQPTLSVDGVVLMESGDLL